MRVQAHGPGVYRYADTGDSYEGVFERGRCTGQGLMRWGAAATATATAAAAAAAAGAIAGAGADGGGRGPPPQPAGETVIV